MTSYLRMIDSAYNSQFEAGFDAYGAYTDGGVGDQPNIAYVTRAYPHAHHFGFAVHARDDADCLDVERFAAVPSDIPGWVARQRKRGIIRPGVYASASLMQSACVPVLRGALIPLSSVRLLSAHYAGRHICGPGSCGLLSVNADGTQWTDRTDNRTADESLLLGNFFGTAPAPQPHPTTPTLEEIVALAPTVQSGSTGQAVKNWQGLLCAHGHVVAIDGAFGNATRAATVAFQKQHGLAQDGVAGPLTLKAALTA